MYASPFFAVNFGYRMVVSMSFFRRAWGLVSTFLVMGMVLLAIALVGVRLVGLTPFAVLSGSMEPTYRVGSLIYVKGIQPEAVRVGMPITFVVNEELLVATHRVTDIQVNTTRTEALLDEAGAPLLDEAGRPLYREVPLDPPVYYFYTKGDANEAEDGAPVYGKNLVGTPVFTVPYLGYLSSWLQTRKGMIAGVSFAVILLLLMFLPDILRSVDDGGAKKKKKRRRQSP